jgi:hypothetical protein
VGAVTVVIIRTNRTPPYHVPETDDTVGKVLMRKTTRIKNRNPNPPPSQPAGIIPMYNGSYIFHDTYLTEKTS